MAKTPVIKDFPLMERWNKSIGLKRKPNKADGITQLDTYLFYGDANVYTQSMFKNGYSTVICFDLSEIHEAYGQQLGGLQEFVNKFCKRFTYFEEIGEGLVTFSADELLDKTYFSKLFSTFWFFVKNMNEFLGKNVDNPYTDDYARTLYREHVTDQKNKHKGIMIAGLILGGAGLVLAIMGLGVLAGLIMFGGVIGAIYHGVKMKVCDNEYFRVRER